MYRDSRVERVSDILGTSVPRREEVCPAHGEQGPEAQGEAEADERQRQSDKRQSSQLGASVEPSRSPFGSNGERTFGLRLRPTQDEPESKRRHQGCDHAGQDKDRKQGSIDEAQLEPERRDDEFHRPTAVHADSRRYAIASRHARPRRPDVPSDELARGRDPEDRADEANVGQASNLKGQADEGEEHGAEDPERDRGSGGPDRLDVAIGDDVLRDEEGPEEGPDDEVQPEGVRQEREP